MSRVEQYQGDLDRPRRRAQFSIENTPSSPDGVLMTPLGDYNAHNRASRRETSFDWISKALG
jgi:hypothetical protein